MTGYSIPSEFLNQNPNSKATFRPGGDAMYVSYLLGGIINEMADERQGDQDFETYHRGVVDGQAANLGFSDGLRVKFLNAGHRIVGKEIERRTKADVKAAKKSAKAQKSTKRELIEVIETGTVKVGRWEYPARELRFSDDIHTVQRNKNRDGSGEWIDMLDGKDAPQG